MLNEEYQEDLRTNRNLGAYKVALYENIVDPRSTGGDNISRLILTSKGLTTRAGLKILSNVISRCDISEKKILLISVPKYDLDDELIHSCESLGFSRENIILFKPHNSDLVFNQTFDYVYVTEGNTFEILDYLRKNGLIELIQEMVNAGIADYIGASAGAMIAGTDIELALDFDNNNVSITDFSSLALFDGTVIPHYTRSELRRYIKNSNDVAIGKYGAIYSVANNRLLIIQTKKY